MKQIFRFISQKANNLFILSQEVVTNEQ